jgi:hypothetical protein
MAHSGTDAMRRHLDHHVAFYETDAFLAEVVAARLAPALADDEHVLIIATRPHLDAFEVAFAALGVDVPAACAGGQLELLDAERTLPTLLDDGVVDVDRFRTVVAELVDRTTADGRPMCIYGEMVALLWGAGNVSAALALEDLWNELAATQPFTLQCGYPLAGFGGEDSDAGFEEVCRRHTAIANEAYVGIDPDGSRPLVLQRDDPWG